MVDVGICLIVGCPSGTERFRIQRIGGETASGAHGQYIPKRHVAVPHTGPSRHTNRRKLVQGQGRYDSLLNFCFRKAVIKLVVVKIESN